MKKKIILPLLLATLVSCNQSNNQPILQGKTESEEMSITTKVPGRIAKLFVSEGQMVKKGDTLAILDIPEVDAKKSQAMGAVESAKAQYDMTLKGATDNQMKQLNAKRDALTEQFNFAQKSLNRMKNMLKDSLISQQKYDEVFAKYSGAKAQLEAVNAEIDDVKNGVRKEQQGMAEGQQNRALGVLKEVNTAEQEKYIIAPADMTIDLITLKTGELALPGYTLFKGTLPKSTYFRFTVPENDLSKVKIGSNFKVHSVYLKQDYDAEVKSVKKLPAYADISTAYPDYEMSQSLFEIRIMPKDSLDLKNIVLGTTVTIKL